MEGSLYDRLGLETAATAAEIKRAYRRLSKTHHPDVGGDAEAFRLIQEAYDVLSDPERRKVYDETGVIPGGDEDREVTLMMERVMQLFDQVTGMISDELLARVDIIDSMIKTVGETIASVQNDIRKKQAAKKRLERLVKRIRRKNGKPSPIVAFLTARIDGIDATIAQAHDAIAKMGKIREFLGEHECVPGEAPPVPATFGILGRSF